MEPATVPSTVNLTPALPPQPRPRARDLGVVIGTLPTGPHNAVTDVDGVQVGHVTLIDGDAARTSPGPARTGVTVVLPHGGNLFRDKVVGAVHVINAFGKAAGTTQVRELGVIETPIVLTNTFAVGTAFNALVDHAVSVNPEIGRTTGTVNPLVAECNDWQLNDIRARFVEEAHVAAAIAAAASGPVSEGVVGAGTGMVCYGWKGGIGTASRRVDDALGGFTLGVLVLANFGRPDDLVINHRPIGRQLVPPANGDNGGRLAEGGAGSIVTVLATDAPTSSRQLERLARRAQSGLARTGTPTDHGSGEYVLAFSTARTVPHWPDAPTRATLEIAEDGPVIEALFRAVVESTEEAVLNALFTAVTTSGMEQRVRYAFPVESVLGPMP
jgi:D-aminopeptidase